MPHGTARHGQGVASLVVRPRLKASELIWRSISSGEIQRYWGRDVRKEVRFSHSYLYSRFYSGAIAGNQIHASTGGDRAGLLVCLGVLLLDGAFIVLALNVNWV